MLVTLKEILAPYLNQNQSVGAFNVTTYGDAQPVIDAAVEKGAPVIVQLGGMATRYMDLALWGKILTVMAERANVPVCIHLDHSKSLPDIQAAIDAGFSSVMFDGSQLPYDENVRLTREVVRRASEKGVSVEAEIGSVAYSGTSKFSAVTSDPDTTARFVADTGIDAVAVAVGTLHWMEQQGSHLDYDLIHKIEEKVSIPLVIHGSSGLCDEDYAKMIATHVCKVNIGTALRMAYNRGLREAFAAQPDNHVFTELCGLGSQYVKDKVSEKLTLLGF